MTFAKTLGQLKDTARLQDNMLTTEQIQETFEEMKLDDERMAYIYDYLQKQNIGIDKPGDKDANLTEEEEGYLRLYLEELRELPKFQDGEKLAVTMSAMGGDSLARDRLVEIFLPEVVEIAKLYAGQGAYVEDLIGEGNVALVAAVSMLDCVEKPQEADGFITKMIMDAMQDLIGNDEDSRQAGQSVLEKVNSVHDKAKEMADELLRKVTVQEVADEMGIALEEVVEAVRLSANHIDYIEDNSNGEQ